jgi:cell pole-organizing protein PopZ
MTIQNGANHHNVDDLLASIRTSIADETSNHRSERGSTYSPNVRRDAAMAQEAAEFELPAIFKPGHHTPIEKPNLLGRLSDALKPSGEPERTRTVIRFEPASAGRMIEPPRADLAANTAEKIAAENDKVHRVMPTFFDTRMMRMSETASAPLAPEPRPVAALPPPQPPMLPETTALGHYGGNVDDVAAQLMRPILKQWLTENMPKIVEKALRSEADHDGERDGQRDGLAPSAPAFPPRKTLR